jgi:hypothetical protein
MIKAYGKMKAYHAWAIVFAVLSFLALGFAFVTLVESSSTWAYSMGTTIIGWLGKSAATYEDKVIAAVAFVSFCSMIMLILSFVMFCKTYHWALILGSITGAANGNKNVILGGSKAANKISKVAKKKLTKEEKATEKANKAKAKADKKAAKVAAKEAKKKAKLVAQLNKIEVTAKGDSVTLALDAKIQKDQAAATTNANTVAHDNIIKQAEASVETKNVVVNVNTETTNTDTGKKTEVKANVKVPNVVHASTNSMSSLLDDLRRSK